MGGSDAIGVIVVEDNALLREEVSVYLRRAGMAVRAVESGDELDRRLSAAPADVVVLDLGLPVEDGTLIARRLRDSYPAMGIIMVTARGRVEERVLGYATGADIYLVKPVDYSELEAAIRALLRGRRDSPAPIQPDGYKIAQQTVWRLNVLARRLTAPSGARIDLTHTEVDALCCLHEGRGQPVSRIEIAARLEGGTGQIHNRYIDQIISRLRRKIASRSGHEAPLRSAYGQGYFLTQTIELE